MTAFRAAFKAYRMHQVLILPRFARLTFALGLATAVFPVDAEYYFNPRFLSNDLAESVDLSAFTKGREAPPGTYRVDIYLNDEFMASRDITFIADDNNADLIPCLSTDLLVSLGIKKSALLDNKEHSADKHVPDNSACTPLQDRLADASSEFDVGQQHLSLSVPQIYVGRMARGYVSPDLWEEGINGNSINNRSNHNAGKSNYAYLNLQSGINIGSWRLRDNSTWSYNSGSSNSSDSNKWQHINTSAERDIIPLRSRLTVGDSYTDGDIFDSVNFRGLKINSTEAMLPDSQHGFAPVIHGIARGTAQVSVKQNGYDVYQTTVPPGPFTIDDINSAANGGDLQVTIKEADGSIQTLYVPYSSVPVLQRAGYTRYALAMGEYRSGNNLQSTPKFVQASLMHGLKGNWTPYGGMQIAEDYQAFNLGIGKDLGLFGAFSFDITQANTTLADDTRHSGQSVKSVYSKSFYQTGTNIQVAGYRYSTQGFYNLSDSAYSRMSGYTVKPPTGDTSEQTLFIDYFNLFYSKRGQEQISISQQLGNYGTTFFSASRQSYWNTSRSDQQISFGLNVPFGDITTSLNYSYSNNIWQNDRDHLLAFTLNVPFSHWMRTDSQSAFHNSNASYSMSNDLKGDMTNLSGVYGTLLPDNNLNYSVQVGNTHGSNTSSGTSGYSSLNISGRVLDYGCTVSSDSLNFTVDLQKNSARQFPTTGSTSPVVPFQITLSECSKGTTGVRVAFNGIEDAENNTLLKLDEGSNTASGLGIEILDGNMRPVKLNDLHAGMQWIPLVPEQNNILPYSARLKSTQKSVNPGLVSASATFTLEFQ